MKKYCILWIHRFSHWAKTTGRALCLCLVLLYALMPAASALTVPNNITVIEEEAFMGDSAMTTLVIHDSVKKVGDAAFADCSALNKITVYATDTVFGENALGRNTETRTIVAYADSTAQAYAEEYGFTFQVIPTKADKLLAYADRLLGTDYDTLDCVTFVRHCYRNALGITIYSTCPDVANKTNGTKITNIADMMPGDIICWRDDDNPECEHVGMYVGAGTVSGKTYSNGVFIESSYGHGAVRYNYIAATGSGYYTRNFMHAWRVITE